MSNYRMVSWWIRWEDLEWPLPQLEYKIRYRADKLAENSVSHAIIFGAHFRWDFMPLWMNLHDRANFKSIGFFLLITRFVMHQKHFDAFNAAFL